MIVPSELHIPRTGSGPAGEASKGSGWQDEDPCVTRASPIAGCAIRPSIAAIPAHRPFVTEARWLPDTHRFRPAQRCKGAGHAANWPAMRSVSPWPRYAHLGLALDCWKRAAMDLAARRGHGQFYEGQPTADRYTPAGQSEVGAQRWQARRSRESHLPPASRLFFQHLPQRALAGALTHLGGLKPFDQRRGLFISPI